MPSSFSIARHEGVLLVHRRDIVEPVEIGHRLQVGLVLDQLLGAAVQQPDMRIDALDDLAVELQHQPQHAVRGRMLRPEVDGEVADLLLGHGRRRPSQALRLLVARQHVLRAFPRRQEVEIAEFLRQLHRLVDHPLLLVVVAHLDEAGQREVLAQRMALEAVVGEDAAQVRVAGEQDAVEVVGLALEPVRAPGTRRSIDGTGVASSVSTLTRMRLVLVRRQQVVDDVEALLARRDSRRRRCR